VGDAACDYLTPSHCVTLPDHGRTAPMLRAVRDYRHDGPPVARRGCRSVSYPSSRTSCVAAAPPEIGGAFVAVPGSARPSLRTRRDARRGVDAVGRVVYAG